MKVDITAAEVRGPSTGRQSTSQVHMLRVLSLRFVFSPEQFVSLPLIGLKAGRRKDTPSWYVHPSRLVFT